MTEETPQEYKFLSESKIANLFFFTSLGFVLVIILMGELMLFSALLMWISTDSFLRRDSKLKEPKFTGNIRTKMVIARNIYIGILIVFILRVIWFALFK